MSNNTKKKLISIVAGGTGGHIFPAISLLKFLENKYNVVVITDNRGAKYFNTLNTNRNPLIKFKLVTINTQSPYKNGFINKLMFILLSIITATKIIIMFIHQRPNLVIGFGGYCSFIPCLLSKIMKIKFFIHEQNAMMGRANKFLEIFATSSFLGFKNTKPNKNIKKRVFCGTPLREEFYKINLKKNKSSYEKQNYNILIFGGSLGADYFSTQIPNMICSLEKKICKKLVITHQVIDNKISSVKTIYRNNKIKANVKSFFPDIIKYFEKADLIIARAGGSTIAEILVSKKPSLIIPLPNSLDNHQFFNSKIISKNKLGWVFDEKKFSLLILQDLLNNFLMNRVEKRKIKKNFEFISKKLSTLSKNKLPNEIINEAISNILHEKT